MAKANEELDPGEEEILRNISAGELSDAETEQLLKDIRKALDDLHMKEALAKAYAERPRGLRAIIRMVLEQTTTIGKPMGQSQPYTGKRPLTESLFAMWRCAVVVAHADGVMHETELTHFTHLFQVLGYAFTLTPEQRGRRKRT